MSSKNLLSLLGYPSIPAAVLLLACGSQQSAAEKTLEERVALLESAQQELAADVQALRETISPAAQATLIPRVSLDELPAIPGSTTTNVTVALHPDGTLFLGDRQVSESQLSREVAALEVPVQAVVVVAQPSVEHSQVVRIIDLLRAEGVTRFAMDIPPDSVSGPDDEDQH